MIVRPLSVTSTPGWPARASAITPNQRIAATMQIATGTWNPSRPDPHHHGEVNATPQRAFQQPSAGHGRRLPIGDGLGPREFPFLHSSNGPVEVHTTSPVVRPSLNGLRDGVRIRK